MVLLLRSINSLKQLHTMAMDVHARYRTEAHNDVVGRFNERYKKFNVTVQVLVSSHQNFLF